MRPRATGKAIHDSPIGNPKSPRRRASLNPERRSCRGDILPPCGSEIATEISHSRRAVASATRTSQTVSDLAAIQSSQFARSTSLGDGVGRALGVGTDLGVGVGLGVAVAVGVDVAVGEAVAVAVPVGVAVTVGVAVAVAVAVGEAVGVGVGVPPPVGDTRT